MAQMLPKLVQSASGKTYDSSSPQGKMIVNSPNYKNPFDKQSTALAPMDPAGSGLAAAGNTSSMGPMEAMQEVFASMADSLESIKESALELVMVSAADTRGDSLNSANVVQDLPPDDDEKDVEKVSKFDKIKGKLPDLKTMGLTALIAGVLLFSEKLKDPLARMLEFFKNIFDRVTTIFGPDATLKERVMAFFGIFTDFGSYLLDIFDGLTSTIASWFGITFDPYDGLGSWIVGKLGDGFQFIKDWFMATAPAWLVDDIANIKDWIISKVTGVFQGIADFFGSAVEAYNIGGFTGLWEWTKDKMLTAFKPIIKFFTGAVDAYKVGGFTGVWEYVKDAIATAFLPITEFFTGATDAYTLGGATGVWEYVKKRISDAFQPIKDWFFSEKEGGGMFDFDGNPTILSWIVDKLKLPFKFLTDLFTFPETDEDGLFSFSFMGKVLTKFVDLVFLPWNLAINFLKGVFQWGPPDEKDETFSLATLIKDVFKSIKDFFKDKFTFDLPSLKLPKLPNFGEMIGALVGGMLPELDSWMWGPLPNNLKVWREMYDAGQAAEAATAMQPVPNPSTSSLANQTSMLEASGTGTTFIQDFSQKSDVKQQNGDVILGADLSADDSDPTEKVLGRVVRPGGFSDVRLKEDIKLVRKSPSDINIYEFKYIGEEGKYEGVMAQEVPWASSIADNGFLWVDYTKLDVDFVKLS